MQWPGFRDWSSSSGEPSSSLETHSRSDRPVARPDQSTAGDGPGRDHARTAHRSPWSCRRPAPAPDPMPSRRGHVKPALPPAEGGARRRLRRWCSLPVPRSPGSLCHACFQRRGTLRPVSEAADGELAGTSLRSPLRRRPRSAKCKYLGQMAHGRQTSSQRAERRVQLRGLGLQNDHDDRCRQAMEAVTSTDLIRVAQKHLQAPRLSLCGPSGRLTELERVWSNHADSGR